MPRHYLLTTISKTGQTLYLHPRADGNYVWEDKKVGAAVWNSYEDAILFKSNTGLDQVRIEAFTI